MLETKGKMIGVFHIAQQEKILTMVDFRIWGVFVYLSCVQNVYILVSNTRLKNKTGKQTTKIENAEHTCQQMPTMYVHYILVSYPG